MALKVYRPVTPSLRSTVTVDRSGLWRGAPHKSLAVGFAKTGGRNNHGRITTRHIGGGARKVVRQVDFKRLKDGVPASVVRIEYDPGRTCFIALVKYEDGQLSYILAPQNLKVGDIVSSGTGASISPGNCLPISLIPVGSLVHNVELKLGGGGQLVRSAGAYAQVLSKSKGYAQLRLRSGEIRLVPIECRASIGALSNPEHQNISHGKAGRSRWLGVRPTVRGVAMNPVDHPHGGGEGKTSGGRHPVTPWGKHTKGKKTRSNKRTQKYILKKRK